MAEFLIMGLQRFSEKLQLSEQRMAEAVQNSVIKEQIRLGRLGQTLVYEVSQFLQDNVNRLSNRSMSLQTSVNKYTVGRNFELDQVKNKLLSGLSLFGIKKNNRIDQKGRLMDRIVEKQLEQNKNQLKATQERLGSHSTRILMLQKERLSLHENSVRLLRPENVLKRGFTLTLKGGKIIKDVRSLELEDVIETQFAKGKIESKIIKKDKHGSKKN